MANIILALATVCAGVALVMFMVMTLIAIGVTFWGLLTMGQPFTYDCKIPKLRRNGFGQVWNSKTHDWEWTKQQQEKIDQVEKAIENPNHPIWNTYDPYDEAWNQHLREKREREKK